MQNLIRFDRHANMNGATREEILDIIMELRTARKDVDIENEMYGLFDGYYYQKYLNEQLPKLKEVNPSLGARVEKVIQEVETYPEGTTQIF